MHFSFHIILWNTWWKKTICSRKVEVFKTDKSITKLPKILQPWPFSPPNKVSHFHVDFSRYRNDTCCKLDHQGTDVYFHVLDPKSGKVLTYNNELVQSKITDKRASSNLKYTVSSLLEVQASEVHQPYLDAPGGLPGSKGIVDPPVRPVRSNFDGLPAALIAIGCLVFAFAFAAILYLCIMRRK